MYFGYYKDNIENCVGFKDAEGVYELINEANNDKDISNKEWDELYEIAKPILEKMSL